MPLDAVHLEAIDAIGQALDRPGRRRDHAELLETIWDVFTQNTPDSPLTALGSPRRHHETIETLGLSDRPFERVSAVDAGSLNPTTFQNGLTVDLAHAAMATTPTDLEVHRRRTIATVAHGATGEVRSDRDWEPFDDGYGRSRLFAAPALDQEEDTAVHTLALERAETTHALANHTEADPSLFILDGAVYPASLLHWEDRSGELGESLYVDRVPREALTEAIELIDRCLADELPVVGFVKNYSARALVRALEGHPALEGTSIPWRSDYGLFVNLLTSLEHPESDSLVWTNWFETDLGTGEKIERALTELTIDTEVKRGAFTLCFMVVYDPREHVCYRIEAPKGVVGEPETRQRVTTHFLGEIAANAGPPRTLEKADALARISRTERRNLIKQLAANLETTPIRQYDDVRWPDREPAVGER